MSFFGSSQPFFWLTGKSRPNRTLNTNSSHNFSANLTKLYRPFGHPKQCVIRWFSFTSVNAYQGFQVVFFANHHLTYIHGMSLRYPGIHALLIAIPMASSHTLKAFSKRGSIFHIIANIPCDMVCTISSGNHAHLYKRTALDTECYSLMRD